MIPYHVMRVDWRSALILISDADSDEHLQLIDSGVLKQLIAEKWKTFAKVCITPVLHYRFASGISTFLATAGRLPEPRCVRELCVPLVSVSQAQLQYLLLHVGYNAQMMDRLGVLATAGFTHLSVFTAA